MAQTLKVLPPLVVPPSLFKENRERLATAFLKAHPDAHGSYVMLQGGKSINKYDSDTEMLFRQEANFFWAFGVLEESWFGAVEMVAPGKAKAILFMPRLPDVYAIWMGKIEGPDYFKTKYGADEVFFTDEIEKILSQKKATHLYTMHGMHSDSDLHCMEAKFDGIDKFHVDNVKLFPVFTELRVHKTKAEIEIFRQMNYVSCEAHKEVMRRCKPGMMEYHLESIFFHTAKMLGGTRYWPYDPICGSGRNGATLHYGHAGAPNDKKIDDGDLIVLDMGAESACFGADITNTIPANGKYTKKQAGIYNIVLKMQKNVLGAMKPGVAWPAMHDLAYRTLLEELVKLGILKGGIDEMMEADMGYVFMPHGLGHLLGYYTHDIGGYGLPGCPERAKKPGFKNLRTARVLEPGLFLTVEPGCYFVDYVLDGALKDEKKAKFINKEMLAQYRGFGGIRIEDNVYVVEGGIDNLTKIPRTVEEIEAEMKAGPREFAY